MSVHQPSEEIIDRVAELLRSQVGLRPETTLRGRLRRCIRDEAADQGLELEGYLQTLSIKGGPLQSLLNRITVQETGFFRHPEHFEALARDILPKLPQPIKIWSAGCANGQEAFSLAMLLEEQGIDGSVIATDVSTAALQRTSTARYSAREVAGLSPHRIARHLVPVGQSWEISRSLRNRVSTLRHNLIEPVPDQVRPCQVVFCRNVLIYFSPQHSREFLDRVSHDLPAAWLFLGSAETIWAVGDRYETVRIEDTFAYRPLAAAAPTPPARFGTSRDVRDFSHDGGAAPISERIESRRIPAAAAPLGKTRLAARRVSSQRATPPVIENDSTAIARLAQAGQRALAANDEEAAVVIFRKWVFLAQDDALAHLHLALALEAAGDHPSAQRAFGAARRALQKADPAHPELAIDGYATAELHKLLDAKQQELTP